MARPKDTPDLTRSFTAGGLPGSSLTALDARSRAIFRQIVETYLATGEPLGSRNLSRALPINLSPASVRNVMADLEALGLIYAPHTSAGRMPTDSGLKLFVDGLLETGGLSEIERTQIDAQIAGTNGAGDILSEVGDMLSGLARCAGLVVADKQTARLKHIEFVGLDAKRALVVMVGEDGSVENRIVGLPPGLPASALVEANNYLKARAGGGTIAESRERIGAELQGRRAELDELTTRLVETGLAQWSGGQGDSKSLIVRGRSHIINDASAGADLERVRLLFDDLDSKKQLVQLLSLAEEAEGVRIFIGAENQLFSLSGSSVIVAPFHDDERRIVGVLGVIGPTRLNYARIIPMVDYTARLVGRLLT